MGIAYAVLNQKAHKLYEYDNAPCFSGIANYEDRNKEAAWILYKIAPSKMHKHTCVSGDPKKIDLYISALKDIGFIVEQSTQEILKDGFLMRLDAYKRNGHIVASELLATLSVIRYLHESTAIPNAFLNLLHYCPDVDKWRLFQFAHLVYSRIYGPIGRTSSDVFGSGHLICNMFGVSPFPKSSWKNVENNLNAISQEYLLFPQWNTEVHKLYGVITLTVDEKSKLRLLKEDTGRLNSRDSIMEELENFVV